MALPTRGRILIETTVGDIEVELWSKETPKTCRNVIALAMEGYYDGVIFHRVVPGFLVQTGDRTGTGGGGESFFGEPFEDEIHPRLRFPHRGLVAMANNGTKDSNDSQFFITLDRADELHGKHTLFGRTVGDSIFNVLKIGSCELGENGRPIYPPKIKTIRILDNPFDDIVPRITAEEKRVQQRAKEESQREREESTRKKTKKNPKLLSFGLDEEADAQSDTGLKKKPIVRPDLIDTGTTQAWIPEPPAVPKKPSLSKESSNAGHNIASKSPEPSKAETKAQKEHHEKPKTQTTDAALSRKREIEKMEAEIRKLTRSRDDSDSEEEKKKKKPKGPSILQQELSKYTIGKAAKRKDGKRKDDGEVLNALTSFRGKVQTSRMARSAESGDVNEDEADEGEEGMEVDNDVGWLTHTLQFPKDNDEEVAKAERDYEVIDPRVRASRAREEQRGRKPRQNRSYRPR